MSNQQQSLPLSVRPVVSYPREAKSGTTYLIEIDLEAIGTIEEWSYEEEEYPVYCRVKSIAKDRTSSLFKVRYQETPAIVLHRFGGTYGSAKFYLTAVDKDIEGEIQITLSSAWGAPLKLIRLENIKVRRELSKPLSKVVDQIDIEALTQTFSIAGQEVTLERTPIEIAEFVEVDDDNPFEGFPPLEEFRFEVPTVVFDEDDPPSWPPIEMQSVEVATIIVEKEPFKVFEDYSERLLVEKEIELEMVAISGGTFLMGSPDSDFDAFKREKPQHEVIVPDFYIGRYPITQEQWQVLMDDNPSRFTGDRYPVENISWNEAVKFCERLAEKTGKEYRLPTEAEWEYACRAGTTTKYYFGNDVDNLYRYAWYDINSNRKTHPVGEKQPNQFNLCDMHGNVWEWCLDHWHDNYHGAPKDGSAWLHENAELIRIIRGGSWNDGSRYCRSAYRPSYYPGGRDNNIGFRVVCVP